MANNSYWRDREHKHIKSMVKEDGKIAGRLKSKQLEAMEGIQDQIDAFYGRYADKEGLSMDEARQRVVKTDVTKLQNKAKKYVKEKNFTKKANEEMRRFNAKMKISRLELLKERIRLELIASGSDQEKAMSDAMSDSAKAEYKRQAGILEKSLNYNEKNIASIVDSSFLSATWSDRLWDNQDALRSELDRLLNRGIVQGKNPRELARNLREKFNTSVYNSERLLRTEMARTQTDVQQDSFEQAGFEEYEYIAQMDDRTSEICEETDGKIFKVKDMEPGTNAPPLHPHCRSSIAAHMDREEWEKEMDDRGLTNDESSKEKPKYKDTKSAFESVKYSGMNGEFAKDIDARLLDLANIYPIGTKDLKIKSLKKSKVFGYFRTGFRADKNNKLHFDNEVVYSNLNMKDKETSSRNHKRSAKVRKAINNNDHELATVDHEYAHAIDAAYTIKKEKLKDSIDQWDGKTIAKRSEVGEVNKLNTKISSSKKQLSQELKEELKSSYNLSERDFFSKIKEEFGNYASTNTKEFLAEGFSAYRFVPTDKQTDFLKDFGKRFERLFKEVF